MSCETDFIIDSRLKIYVDTFYFEASNRGINLGRGNLVVKLQKNLFKNSGALGVSKIETGLFTNKQETVYIDEEYFLNYPKWKVECVIFHELGHTLLNRRDHTNQVPSVMNLHGFYSGYCYGGYFFNCQGTEDQRKVLLDELFYGK